MPTPECPVVPKALLSHSGKSLPPWKSLGGWAILEVSRPHNWMFAPPTKPVSWRGPRGLQCQGYRLFPSGGEQ